MSNTRKYTLVAGALLLAGSTVAQAAAITLPDSAQSTIMTATVSEQAQVTVPAGVLFSVNNVTASTAASGASVSVSNIVLASATKQLKISLQASAASFTPPVALATTWAPADVSWDTGSWTSAVGVIGTLSSGAYTEVATCALDTAACNTSALVFTLAGKPSVQRSGNHTLAVTWKFEAIGA